MIDGVRLNLDHALAYAPNRQGMLRYFYPDGKLWFESFSPNISFDLWRIKNDWSSPLRQAASFEFNSI